MHLPAQSASSQIYLHFTTHTGGAVEAWRDAEVITAAEQAVVIEVGEQVSAAMNELVAREAAAEQAARVASKARARFGVRDAVLDLRVMATSDGVLNGPGLRKRESPIFKQVFLNATGTDIVRAKVREEPELAARLYDRLGKAPDFPGRGVLLKELGEAVERSMVARQALLAAEQAEATAKDDERLARLALRHTLQEVYGKLLATFPGRKSFVETFFPKRVSAAGASGEADDDPKVDVAPDDANG